MSELFSPYDIYPHGDKNIKEHFSACFDEAYIALLPFFTIDGLNKTKSRLDGRIFRFDNLENLPPKLERIAGLSAKYSVYPEDNIIQKKSKVIKWIEIVKGCSFKDFSELSKALDSSIGKLRPIFKKQDLAERLASYTVENNIWHPVFGDYDVLSKIAIYNAFKLLGKTKIIAHDETWETTLTLNLDELTENEFCSAISGEILTIYSEDRKLLFTMHWDNFYFYIAANKEEMDTLVSANLFDGFLCNDETTNEWNYEVGELDELLALEKRYNEGIGRNDT